MYRRADRQSRRGNAPAANPAASNTAGGHASRPAAAESTTANTALQRDAELGPSVLDLVNPPPEHVEHL